MHGQRNIKKEIYIYIYIYIFMAMYLKALHRNLLVIFCVNCEHQHNRLSYHHPYSTLDSALILFHYEQ